MNLYSISDKFRWKVSISQRTLDISVRKCYENSNLFSHNVSILCNFTLAIYYELCGLYINFKLLCNHHLPPIWDFLWKTSTNEPMCQFSIPWKLQKAVSMAFWAFQGVGICKIDLKWVIIYRTLLISIYYLLFKFAIFYNFLKYGNSIFPSQRWYRFCLTPKYHLK